MPNIARWQERDSLQRRSAAVLRIIIIMEFINNADDFRTSAKESY